MSAFKRIRKAMIAKERKVFAYIRREHKAGGYGHFMPSSHAWRHAEERLEAKGRIKWSKSKGRYVPATGERK
jgi:hypothetical protein